MMVFSDFDVLFSDLRQVRPDIPRLMPNIMLDLFIVCLYYFYRYRIEKDEQLDFTDLLWQVFAIGLISTIMSLGTRLIVLATGRSAIASNILFNYIIYSVNLSLFLGFLVGTFIAWKRLITYQKEKWPVRLWTLFEIGLAVSLIHDSLGIRLNSVVMWIVLITLVVVMVRLWLSIKWVAFLNFRQKLTSLLLMLMILFYLVYLAYTVSSLSNTVFQVSQQFLDFNVHGFNLVITLFVTAYSVWAFLVILFNLPTSSAFEQKLEESHHFQRLSQSIQTGQDEESVYPILLESAVKSLSADAAWVELRSDGKEGVLHTYLIEADHARLIADRLRQKAISLIPESGTYKKIGLSRYLRDEDTRFRSMVVCPLKVEDRNIGLICVVREVPDGFTANMISSLVALANQAGISIGNFRLIDQVVQGERYKEELKIARRVQKSLLPSHLEQDHGIDMDAGSDSPDEVGGDYYDTLRLPDGRIAGIIADVSGKGTTAAFHMSQMKGVFHSLARISAEPASFLTSANSALSVCLERGSFISAIYFVIDSERREFHYARAGHCPLLRYHATDRNARYAEDKGMALALIRKGDYSRAIQTQTVPIQDGDVLVLFTDGITEARNLDGQEFGYDRLRHALVKSAETGGAAAIRTAIMEALYDFTAHRELNDDHTMLVVRFGPAGNPGKSGSVTTTSPIHQTHG